MLKMRVLTDYCLEEELLKLENWKLTTNVGGQKV